MLLYNARNNSRWEAAKCWLLLPFYQFLISVTCMNAPAKHFYIVYLLVKKTLVNSFVSRLLYLLGTVWHVFVFLCILAILHHVLHSYTCKVVSQTFDRNVSSQDTCWLFLAGLKWERKLSCFLLQPPGITQVHVYNWGMVAASLWHLWHYTLCFSYTDTFVPSYGITF